MDKKYSAIHYHKYLQLDKILGAQEPRSKDFGEEAHDETLFIVIHQVYELWFKEIIHDLNSVMKIFSNETVPEKDLGIAVQRLERIIEIQKILIDQIVVLETLTPLDFLDFRNYLMPASGFQSFQFRVVEVALGLKSKNRMTYNNTRYASVFTEQQQAQLQGLEDGDSMLQLIEKWLERIPFMNNKNFDFINKYKQSVNNMLTKEKASIQETDYISQDEKDLRLRMLGDTDTYFEAVLDEKVHSQQVKDGKIGISYKATMGALLINLYRDEPMLRMPYILLNKLVDIDIQFTTWRFRHAQMVQRMLGKKIGTGGSSGYDYLRNTADKHKIFIDLQYISTLLIPRSEIPEMPEDLKYDLGFHFSNK